MKESDLEEQKDQLLQREVKQEEKKKHFGNHFLTVCMKIMRI